MPNSPQYLSSWFYFVPVGPSNQEQHIHGKVWKKAEADDEQQLKGKNTANVWNLG